MQSLLGILEKHSVTFRTLEQRVKAKKGFSWAFAVFFDCLIGAAVAHLLTGVDFYGLFWPFIDAKIGQLDEVITWLLSNPVGLKLNEPLNTALASFFRYHIYLWHTFVQLLRVSWLWRILPLCLYAGISLSAAIMADLISIFSMHVICFHIYAYRLFLLTFTSLNSLWRAFRGKKYNPLRNRVDTALLDSRQLFLANILFVILLFLAPTVAVYCFVFSSLRWAIRAVQLLVELISRFQKQVDLKVAQFGCE